jgi:hypothetical protein
VVSLPSTPCAGTGHTADRARAPDQTLFFGTVTDEARLYQVLMWSPSLGLAVLEMRLLPRESHQEEL